MTTKTRKPFDKILKATSKTRSLAKVFTAVHKELAEEVGADSVALFLSGDTAPFVLYRKTARGAVKKKWLDAGVFEQSIVCTATESSRAAWKKPKNDPLTDSFLGAGNASFALLPLVSQGKTVGALAATGKKGRGFSAAEKTILKSYAGLISPIVHLHKFSSHQLDFSFTDSLTGLRNFHFLQLKLEEEINRVDRYKGSFSLILVDIDRFRAFNDKWGYRIGTRALVRVARIIEENLRQTDMACRFGMDAFAVVLTRTSLEEAQLTSDRIRKKIARTDFSGGPKKAAMTVSTGIAVYPGDSSLQSGMIEAAEMALAKAKSKGLNKSFSFATMLAE